MGQFGDLFRSIDDAEVRLKLFGDLLDLGRGEIDLRLIGSGKTAEIYEVIPDHQINPPLVVKAPPFRMVDDEELYDQACFSILREMRALSMLGSSAFANMASDAKSVLGVPALIFLKRDTDLRQLIMADKTAADRFVRLALLHMIAKGLARAQEKGVIIHQDLKPENIILHFTSQHYVVTGDFPALIIPRINDFEFTNHLIGERLRGFRPYLPKEHYDQFEGKVGLNNRYDVYSLAIIAHELLTYGFHPLPNPNDARGLHCSEFVDGLKGPYKSEEKWKKFARKPKSEKPLHSIDDRLLADTLSSALAPEFESRPTSSEMADAFLEAMKREDPGRAEQVGITIDFFEKSDETGSGDQARFPQRAQMILDEAPTDPLAI